MRAKLIYVENGKITFTKKELEDLLKSTYDEGYADGMNYVKNTQPYIEIKDGNVSNRGSVNNPNPWASPFVYNGDIITGSTTATLKIDDSVILTNNGTSSSTVSVSDVISTSDYADKVLTATVCNTAKKAD